MSFHQRLDHLGLILPQPVEPLGNYAPWVFTDHGTLVLSGQLPWVKNKLSHEGKVGAEVKVDEAYDAARFCLLQGLARIHKALDGDMGRLERCLHMAVFVACAPNFFDLSKVANGASDLLVDIFQDCGLTTRATVGVTVLPMNAPVELQLTVQVKK